MRMPAASVGPRRPAKSPGPPPSSWRSLRKDSRSLGPRTRLPRDGERFLVQIWKLQVLAFDAVALTCPGAGSRAKALQLEAGEGEPLTVCVGDLSPRRLPDLRDVLDPAGELEEYKIPTIAWNTLGSGCLTIFADSKGLHRRRLRSGVRRAGARARRDRTPSSRASRRHTSMARRPT